MMTSVSDTRARALGGGDSIRVASLLEQVEALPRDAAGAFVFGSRPNPAGTILVENRRICWAVSRLQRHRLADILRHQSSRPLEKWTLDSVYAHCKETGEPFGQTLVNRGLASSEQLKHALREHAAEALATLVDDMAEEPEWVGRDAPRHDPQFTFSTTEVLSIVGELRWGPVAAQARDGLARFLENGGRGVAVIRDGDRSAPLIVGEYGGEQLGVGGIISLGILAVRMIDERGGRSRTRFATMIRDDRSAVAAWERDGIVFGALCEDASSLACVIARFSRPDEE